MKVNRHLDNGWRSSPVGYFIAFAAIAVATLIKLLLSNAIQQGSPFVWFFGAVILATWLGGR